MRMLLHRKAATHLTQPTGNDVMVFKEMCKLAFALFYGLVKLAL